MSPDDPDLESSHESVGGESTLDEFLPANPPLPSEVPIETTSEPPSSGQLIEDEHTDNPLEDLFEQENTSALNAAPPTIPAQPQLREEIRFLSLFFGSLTLCILAIFFLYRSIWIPIIIGVVAGYLLDPWVRFLSQKTKLPRAGIVLSALIVFSVILATFLILVIPYVKNQLTDIIALVPETYDGLITSWTPRFTRLQNYLRSIGLSTLANFSLMEYQELFSLKKLSDTFKNTIGTLWSSLPGIISFVVGLLLVPCLMYISLQHSPKVQRFVFILIPEEFEEPVRTVFRRLSTTLRAVIAGQIYVALTLGVLYCIGYSILGIKGAVAIGLAAGAGRLIPYMDMVIAAVLSTAVILSSDGSAWTPLIGSAIVIIVVSILDAAIVTPKLIGSSAGIHPIIVICTIIAFSSLLGFWGVIIAIPVIAMLKETLIIIIEYYRRWKVPHKLPPS
ncbi:MAG: AI-2E family transporter [Proteobacteria bacterium]|nr:AI-2E family transporter [Pseudomonadota bacterium]